jgi:nucleoside-diphosphate-sugar epimerase
MDKRTALVAGAGGIVGRNLIDRLLELGTWNVIGVSRRTHDSAGSYSHVSLDLLNRRACESKLAELRDVTNVFFAARAPNPDPTQEADANQAMLANLLEPIEEHNRGLLHVNLVHGSKWYGSQFGPYKTPARENDARGFGRHFYFDQQDYIAAKQRGKKWTWSTVRPHGVYGYSVGYPHNIMTLLAVYAVVSRELGLPLRYPGKGGAFTALSQATDVRLLADSMIWVSTTPQCANQAFNVGNGDNFRWQNVWPRIAALFSMECGPVQEIKMASLMPKLEPIWNSVVKTHSLLANSYQDLANWTYGDRLFSVDWDNVYSLAKIRNAGFLEFVDTEDMILRYLEDFRSRRVIP